MAQESYPPEMPSFSTEEELEQLLLEGLNSGEPIEATPEFWADLQRQLEADSQARRTELKKAS